MLACIYSLFAGNYSINFFTNDFQIVTESGYDVVKFAGLGNTEIVGAPQLPIKFINFIIPPGMVVNKINLSKNTQEISGQYKIIPVQQPVPSMIGYVPGPFVNPDSLYYGSNELYPLDAVKVVSYGYFDGNAKIVTVAVYPLQYKPIDQKLILNNSLSFSFTFSSSQDSPIIVQQRSFHIQDIYDGCLSQLVVNPEDIPNYYQQPNLVERTPAEYQIIAPSQYLQYFDDFVNWKKSKGFSVHINSIESIITDPSNPGDIVSGLSDEPGKIRYFLNQQYLQGLGYVLLVGDETNFPIRYGNIYDDAMTQLGFFNRDSAVDLYYADFNGDWNVDLDPKLGEMTEDNPDFLQEIFCGRLLIPSPVLCPNASSLISNWTEKLISYELYPGYGDYSFIPKAFYTRADQLMFDDLQIQQGFLFDAGFEVDVYGEDNGWDGPLGPPTGNQTIARVNEGYGLTTFDTHACPWFIQVSSNLVNNYPFYNVSSLNSVWGDEDANGLDNLSSDGKYSVMYVAGCSGGKFDADGLDYPCFPFVFNSLHEKGGPAMIALTNDGIAGATSLLENKFVTVLFGPPNGDFSTPPNSVGVAHAGAKALFASNLGGKYHSYVSNLFGDPEMNVWTAAPHEMVVEYDTSQNILNVTSNGIGVPNAFVFFFNDDFSDTQLRQTNENGELALDTNLNNFCVRKTNFIPALQHILFEDEIWNDVRHVDYDVIVPDGRTLYIFNDVYLGSTAKHRNAKIIVKDGGAIVFESGNIYGENATCDINNPDLRTIYGNRVEVYGNISFGPSVSFTAEPGHTWDGLYLDVNHRPLDVSLSGISFTNCNLQLVNGSLNITNSTFTNSLIKCDNGVLSIEDCQTLSGIECYHCKSVLIKNNIYRIATISGSVDGVKLTDCGAFEIKGYTITNHIRCGIDINESYNFGSRNLIKDCVINNNAEAGIRFYHSGGLVVGNLISDNGIGIVSFRCSNIQIEKDPGTEPWFHDSVISHNLHQEILFYDDCDISMDNSRNKILDDDFEIGTFDEYLVQCPDMIRNRSFRYNMWEINDNEESVYPSSDRFYPSCLEPEGEQVGYFIDPIWELGYLPQVNPENDEVVYYAAIDYAIDDNPEEACRLFKELISQCPESEYAPASAKNLMALESNKEALKYYYHNEPNLHWNGEIDKLADYLENYCNIKLGNYQEAIQWFEVIISDPPSELDSLMAVIDLGYIYCLMMENPPKSPISCMFPQLKPKTKKEFESSRNMLLSNLYFPKMTTVDVSSNNPVDGVLRLKKNYPNPFNSSTTISFSLPKDMKCNLIVYNVKGQKLKTLFSGTQTKGNHTIVWNGVDDKGKQVSSGVYFYKLVTPDKSITMKMIMMK